MKKLEQRIMRLESKLPAKQLVVDQQESDQLVEFVRGYNRMEERLRLELAERGQLAVVRRVLDGGSELEWLALLSRLGHCPHTVLLVLALGEEDDTNELLIWWREAAPLTLRRLLGEDIPPVAPFVFHSPELSAATSNVEALRIFERLRANLEQHSQSRRTAR